MEEKIECIGYNESLYQIAIVLIPISGLIAAYLIYKYGNFVLYFLYLPVIFMLFSPFIIYERMINKEREYLKKIIENIEEFNLDFLSFSSWSQDSLSFKFAYGVDKQNNKLACAQITPNRKLKIHIYYLKDLKICNIDQIWEDVGDIREYSLIGPGNIIDVMKKGVTVGGAIGRAILASYKTQIRNKSLIAIKLRLQEKDEQELVLPLFVASTIGWEYKEDKLSVEEDYEELEQTIMLSNAIAENNHSLVKIGSEGKFVYQR